MPSPGSLGKAAVLGRPIEHSLSPVLHNAAYAELGLDWTYSAIDCGTDDLEATLAARTDWAGFSCTMPLKRAALELATVIRPRAAAVGAANTLLPLPDGGWAAENTDVAGIVAALAGARIGTATVIGAGGTAQAAVAALAELGCSAVTLLVRDPTRTAEIRATADAVAVPISVELLSADAAALGADVVVSTLPPGAADPLLAADWRAGQTVLDVVYAPWPTLLASAAQTAGAQIRSGALMLLHQAVAQVELMTHLPAPVDAMRLALHEATPSAGL